MSTILAIDLGKFKSVACTYQTAEGRHEFRTIPTRPQEMHDLIAEVNPQRVVIEVGSSAGWVKDLCEALEVEVQVANPNHEAWRPRTRWKNVKRKSDRDDALKLAQLSAIEQLPQVKLPGVKVRQWRQLIRYRHTLIGRRTAIKNYIRGILDGQGLSHPGGKSGWTQKSIGILESLARPLAEVSPAELWRGRLHLELQALAQLQPLIEQVELKLEELAKEDGRVAQLQSIPGVGPRLAEMVVATIDDPKRFKTGRQVGAYAGLTPRLFESGTMQRQGRISGRGNKLLRALLVEVSWLMRRYNGHFRQVFERICKGSKKRRKIAVVATARKLLVTCWAMLRDGTRWRTPAPAAIR